MTGSFEVEVLPHLPVLRRVARTMVHDPAGAEDLVQDALLRACRFWHLYRPGTSVRAWLMTIVRHCFISDYRKSRRTPVLMEFDESAYATGPRPSLAVDSGSETGALTDTTVLNALRELRPKYRQALLLSDLEGLSLGEISRRLGIPLGTVKSRIFRARREARAKLREHALTMGYLTRRPLEGGSPGRRVA